MPKLTVSRFRLATFVNIYLIFLKPTARFSINKFLNFPPLSFSLSLIPLHIVLNTALVRTILNCIFFFSFL